MPRRIRSLVLLAVVGLALCTGCNKPAPPVGSAAPAAVSVGPPVTHEEAWAFGEKVTEAMKAKDVPALSRLLRIDDLLERIVSDFGFSTREQADFRAGVAKSGGSQKMLGFWVQQLGGGASKRLRVGERDGRTSVLTRMVGEDGSVNYFDFPLIRTADGQVVAEDIYLMAAGEKFSQLLRGMIIPMVAELKKGSRSPAAQTQLDNMVLRTQLGNAVRDGQHEEAVRLYRRLPADMRNEKVVQIIGLQVLSQVDEAGYIAEIERYRQVHPNDPSVDLLSVDYYYLKKDVPSMRECIRRIETAIGTDPYLWVLEANVLSETGKPDEAKKLADKAIKAEPTLVEAYWSLVTIAIAQDDHKETARVLRAIVEKFKADVSADSIAMEDLYKRFAKSPEFAALRTWLAARGK